MRFLSCVACHARAEVGFGDGLEALCVRCACKQSGCKLVPKGVAGRALFASVMTWQLCVRGAVLFCGLTHPEATAATR